VPSWSPWFPISSYPRLLAPSETLLSNFVFSSNGNEKKAVEPVKTASWSERGIPWPTSWKKPVVMHAMRTCSTILRALAEVGSRRYGAMSTVGIWNAGLETVILLVDICCFEARLA